MPLITLFFSFLVVQALFRTVFCFMTVLLLYRKYQKVIGFAYHAVVKSAERTDLMKEMVKSQTRLSSSAASVREDVSYLL